MFVFVCSFINIVQNDNTPAGTRTMEAVDASGGRNDPGELGC